MHLSNAEISLGKRESVYDVAKNIERMVQAIMIRTFGHEIVEQMAEYANLPVINGLTDFSHPCQAMAVEISLSFDVVDPNSFRPLNHNIEGFVVVRSKSIFEINEFPGAPLNLSSAMQELDPGERVHPRAIPKHPPQNALHLNLWQGGYHLIIRGERSSLSKGLSC